MRAGDAISCVMITGGVTVRWELDFQGWKVGKILQPAQTESKVVSFLQQKPSKILNAARFFLFCEANLLPDIAIRAPTASFSCWWRRYLSRTSLHMHLGSVVFGYDVQLSVKRCSICHVTEIIFTTSTTSQWKTWAGHAAGNKGQFVVKENVAKNSNLFPICHWPTIESSKCQVRLKFPRSIFILLNLSCILAFKFASKVACVDNYVSHNAFHLSHSNNSSNSRKYVHQSMDIQVGTTEVHKAVPAYLLVLGNGLAKSLAPAVD